MAVSFWRCKTTFAACLQHLTLSLIAAAQRVAVGMSAAAHRPLPSRPLVFVQRDSNEQLLRNPGAGQLSYGLGHKPHIQEQPRIV